MKAMPLAFACALLGATALAPTVTLAQAPSPPGAAQSSGSDRDDRNRDGWRSSQRDDDWDRGSQRRGDWDDDDDDGDEPYERRSRDRMGKGMGMGPGMAAMHERMMRGHHRMGHGAMSGGQRGARLNLKRGDSAINIRCPSNEPIAACVEAVTKLMDKLQSVPQTP